MNSVMSEVAMSKFHELSQIYSQSRKKFFDYQSDIHRFAKSLTQGLIDYLSIPAKHVKLFPVFGEIKPDTEYSVKEAIMLGDDNFWHLGIQIDLICDECRTIPAQPILLNIGLKQEEGRFLVKLSQKEKGHEIREDKDADLHEFYEFIFESIKKSMQTGLLKFLEKEPTPCRVGFLSECS